MGMNLSVSSTTLEWGKLQAKQHTEVVGAPPPVPPSPSVCVEEREKQPRFLFYSHDALGLGHTRRNLAIADALCRASPGVAVLLATGLSEAYQLGLPPGMAILKLPGLCKLENGSYAARHLAIPAAEILELRSELLK